jgi:hypothetical protein
VDPLSESGKRIREHGYNSPFEEVVIAERLRQLGVPTTYPRAIYRTAHQSTEAGYLRDRRRYADHAHVSVGSPPESVLFVDYDYYTIWDYFRGCDPERGWQGGQWIDLEQAREQGLVQATESQEILRCAQSILAALGSEDENLDEHEFALRLDGVGQVCRNDRGEMDITLGIDAMCAYEAGFLDDAGYRAVIKRLDAKLRSADCEKLDLSGAHVLLSLNLAGQMNLDRDGEPIATLCNFECIRGLYRPIR